MRPVFICLLLSFANPAGSLRGEDQPAREPVRQPIEAAAERQRAAVLATTTSAEAAQRTSVRKQIVSASAGPGISDPESYFMLPSFPPPEMPVAFSVTEPECEPLAETQLDPLVAQAVLSTGVKSELLRAVIHQESRGQPCAVSRAGAQGLMQLMPATAEQFGVTDVFDPRQNILAGAKFLKQLLERYAQDLPRALAAYNAGPGQTDRVGAVPPFAETQDYVRSIMENMQAPQLATPQPPEPLAAPASPPPVPAVNAGTPSGSAPTVAQKKPLSADKP